MPVQDSDTLKSYFTKKAVVPTPSNYIDLIDSMFAGGGEPTEGPGIDLISTDVGIGGDSILLYDSGGEPVLEFEATSAGLVSALAAMASGDVVELPDILISGGPWTVAYGTLRGHSKFGSILDGELTLSEDCVGEQFSIIRSVDDADVTYGAILYHHSRIDSCYIVITNADGDAIGVYSPEQGSVGDCYADDIIMHIISVNGVGYGYASDGCNVWAEGGKVVASTSPIRPRGD